MSTIQIHQFPTIPQAPEDADVLAIEVNGITYKVSKGVLAAAIIDKLGGDPVTVGHGGTGASTAANARTNLSVYSKSETDSAIQQSAANLAVANEYSGNIDNTLKTGLYYLSGATGTGIGSNGAWGMLIVVTLGARSVQIYADVWDDSVKYRRYSGSWSAWKNFTLS